MVAAQRTLNLTLHGLFSIQGHDGIDITPRSAKAQALIALLATSKNFKRSRVWLQDKLWSDRPREQGSASMRQAVSEIRRHFKHYDYALNFDRKNLALNPECFELDSPNASGNDFLEGMDIRDPEFEEWLCLMRSQFHDEPSPQKEPISPVPAKVVENASSIVCCPDHSGSPMEAIFADVFVGTLAKSLQEQLGLGTTLGSKYIDDQINLEAKAVFNDGHFFLQSTCFKGSDRRVLWSGSRTLEARGAPPVEHDDVLQLANEAVDSIGELLNIQLWTNERNPAALIKKAIAKLFTMNPSVQSEAATLLDLAHEFQPRGTTLAWKLFLRIVQMLEMHDICRATVREEIKYLEQKAIELEPMNSFVCSIVAYSKFVISGKPTIGYDLARRSVAINPANPFGWQSLSTAEIYLGRFETAHENMARARYLGSRSPYKYWWDMAYGLTSITIGKHQEALKVALSAHLHNPEFRPPIRYLIALFVRAGKYDAAFAQVEALRALEPDFEVSKLPSDKDYPAVVLQKCGLISASEAKVLI